MSPLDENHKSILICVGGDRNKNVGPDNKDRFLSKLFRTLGVRVGDVAGKESAVAETPFVMEVSLWERAAPSWFYLLVFTYYHFIKLPVRLYKASLAETWSHTRLLDIATKRKTFPTLSVALLPDRDGVLLASITPWVLTEEPFSWSLKRGKPLYRKMDKNLSVPYHPSLLQHQTQK